MTDEMPRRTLKVTRKLSVKTDADDAVESGTSLRLPTKKRMIKLDSSARKSKQLHQSQAKKKKRVAPSVIRESDLNKVLSNHSKSWRSYRPLDLDIEKQVFQFIGKNHLSASKRVVKSLLKKHHIAKNYLLNEVIDAPRYDLNDNETGVVTWEQASVAAKLLVKVEAQRAAEKRAKRKT